MKYQDNENEAASSITINGGGASNKREGDDTLVYEPSSAKIAKTMGNDIGSTTVAVVAADSTLTNAHPIGSPKLSNTKAEAEGNAELIDITMQVAPRSTQPILRAAPYFYYTDHSQEKDTEPPTFITQPGQVPTCPSKLHAILSIPELQHIIAWDTHGRSFNVLKPRIFETEVLPKYFAHSKMTSFLRLVNGWNFRRLTSDDNPNSGSYYNEYFLRSMPWLCNKMFRPRIGEKLLIPEEHEPNLVSISADFPVPDFEPTREVQIICETIERGAKTRMPLSWSIAKTQSLPPPLLVPKSSPRVDPGPYGISGMRPEAQSAAAVAYITALNQPNDIAVAQLDAMTNALLHLLTTGMLAQYPAPDVVAKLRREFRANMILHALHKYHGNRVTSEQNMVNCIPHIQQGTPHVQLTDVHGIGLLLQALVHRGFMNNGL